MRRFSDLPFVAALRDALPWSFGALIAAIIGFLPFSGSNGAASFGDRLAGAYLPAFGVMAGALAVIVAIVYARRSAVSPVPTVAATVVCFALLLPRPFGPDALSYLREIGPSGLFLAMVTSGLVALTIDGARRARLPLADWIGALFAIVVVGLLLLAHVSVIGVIMTAIAPLARVSDTYPALMLIVFLQSLFWVAGIHGSVMLTAVATPVYLTLQKQNTEAFLAHHALPNIIVVSFFLFIFPGGAGATLPLAVLLAFSRVQRLRKVGRVTLVPAIFNTNEPLLFGTPVVFNPYLAVPFMIVPLVLATTTYLAVASGMVARAAYYLPSSIPTVVSTYLATLDPRAVVLVMVNIVIAGIIYFPFVRAYERHVEKTT